SSLPDNTVCALKYTVPPTRVGRDGLESCESPVMSPTWKVPESVPSLCHNSRPLTPSVAEKYNLPLIAKKLVGAEPAVPGLMSLTHTVPPAVPSLFHSSTPNPLVPPLAEKKSVPP